MNIKGKVYLIGAGPGDPDLLTLKAYKIIETADILIYDNLVNDAIVNQINKNECKKIYVGKKSSDHTLTQDNINQLLVELAGKYENIVRLKGGDPFIFGRGGEEALELARNNIPFEVINGISSAYAVPAYAGIPVTHRGIASSVAFITGHEDPAKDTSDINWENLATAVQTHVFLMGVKNLPLIVDKLIEYGRNTNTGVAVIRNGTYPGQQTVTGNLENIVQKVHEAGIKPPAIIIVGDVVNLRDQVSWFETKPLFAKRIIVTRSRSQASVLVDTLRNLGADAIEVPAIKTERLVDNNAIFEAIKSIDSYDWIIFTSANGVNAFFSYMEDLKKDSRFLSGRKICAIGPATQKALGQYGIRCDLVPGTYLSTDIIASLKEENEIEERSFLLPRADIAPQDLPDALLENGAKAVQHVTVYRTIQDENSLSDRVIDILRNNSFDLVTFTSSSTVSNFKKIMEKIGTTDNRKISCMAIGPVTANTAREAGFDLKMTAKEYTIPGLVESILEYYQK